MSRKRRQGRHYDLDLLIIGATSKPSRTDRKAPKIRVLDKDKYKGQCATCGGSRVIKSPTMGITWLCPDCTGYQRCGV